MKCSRFVIDKKLEEVYTKIYELKGGKRAGCFDIIAYKENHFVFAELKKKKEDKIRSTQIEWLKAAMTLDLDRYHFFIAEWETII